ncbi:MAG: S-layer protein precursor [Candidatus Methanofastidiosum methylothiophilum]|uniref:S-layer protein n=1 Tax=Candidatus Methanofastidiosum methylothiophilum TaxID=1705564 RepID=A0A150J348_9EURY|nr:MAG: S-layer protein precursor [Candidatus Methanofastidiosum methylthiophilus]KYC48756.1 MAG: S-layer protein precursor [Candidatus Methanofastidiosum methylthiophilus]KYC51404.1 MAG: S-layer protein precursor [Candidatus Methanofastidiosum methylthiophilus]
MRIKMLGAALTGALMLGATLAGAASAATVPPKSFFIDPLTGAPDVVIAVGATANASDVVSASLIAAAVGNMATVEETRTVTRTASATFDYMMDYNYTYDRSSKNIEYYNSTCTDTAAWAKWYTDYELFSTQFWETASGDGIKGDKDVKDYDISVAIAMPKEIRNPDGYVVARELNTLWFSNSPKDWDSNNRIYYLKPQSGAGTGLYYLVNTKVTAAEVGAVSPTANIVKTLPAYAGGSYDNGNGSWDFNYVTGEYAFFSTKAWVNVTDQTTTATYAPKADCDYVFGGTGTEMEPHEEIQIILADIETTPDGLVDMRGDRGSASGIIYRTAEIRYPLLENGQNICGISNCDGMVDFETARTGRFTPIKFLGKMYQPMFAGATYNSEGGYLGAYFTYGKPYAEKEKIMKVGDSYNFHGWTINLSDVNIYENKAFITVSGPDLASPFSFIMVMDSLGDCGPCCPDCAIYGGGGAFTSNPTRRNEYDPYRVKITKTKEVDGRTYNLFNYVPFMLDGIKTFVGADGTYLAEFNIYAVEDFGWFEDKGCCDPFVTTPNDYGLAITGGWRKVAYNATTQDVSGWFSWEDGIAAGDRNVSQAYILWQPAPRCNTPCPDANFDTLELQLCDNIDIPDCETAFTVNGPENYFSVVIQDVDFGKKNKTLNFDTIDLLNAQTPYDQLLGYYETTPITPETILLGVYAGRANSDSADVDGAKIMISQTTVDTAQSITYTKSVNIDPIELIKLDIEINTASLQKNLVLVGGPVYNSIVRDLGNMGASTVNWAASPGEWEWIADPFGRGYDVLIVAGANREETRLAAQQLVSQLR